MSVAKLRSVYVLHDELGQPFDARKIGDIFRAACRKAGITGVTLKDIRSKAATDAGDMGYSEEQLKTALAHTDSATTRVYLRGRKVPVSEVILKVPKA
jgi:translation initiation factor IF-3